MRPHHHHNHPHAVRRHSPAAGGRTLAAPRLRHHPGQTPCPPPSAQPPPRPPLPAGTCARAGPTRTACRRHPRMSGPRGAGRAARRPPRHQRLPPPPPRPPPRRKRQPARGLLRLPLLPLLVLLVLPLWWAPQTWWRPTRLALLPLRRLPPMAPPAGLPALADRGGGATRAPPPARTGPRGRQSSPGRSGLHRARWEGGCDESSGAGGGSGRAALARPPNAYHPATPSRACQAPARVAPTQRRGASAAQPSPTRTLQVVEREGALALPIHVQVGPPRARGGCATRRGAHRGPKPIARCTSLAAHALLAL